MSRIMVTNGGPHPPEKWALITAERIFPIDDVVGDRQIHAQKFQLTIAELLMPHHTNVQTSERNKLEDNIQNLLTPYDVESYLDTVLKDIVNASKGTPWQAHFAREEVQNAAKLIIGGDIATIQHIERQWHADYNPDSTEAQSYNEMWNGRSESK